MSHCFPMLRLGLAVIGLALSVARPAAAQPADPSPMAAGEQAEQAVESPDRSVNGRVREVRPELYYLRDKEGNLVLVPDFSFERWEELVRRASEQMDPHPPAYSFQRIALAGNVEQGHAVLQARYQIRLTQRGSEAGGSSGDASAENGPWIRIPLRLAEAVLQEPPDYDGPGEQVTAYEPEGYVCWLRAAENTDHTLSLKIKVPLVQVGEETRLALTTPRYSTELKLVVGMARLVASLNNEDRHHVLANRPLPGNRSELTVESVGGALQVAWRQQSDSATRPATVLEATGSVLVKIEGKQTISSEATLKLRSFGEPIETFKVRLPAGMQLLPINQTGFQVIPQVPFPVDEEDSAGRNGQLVEVKLDRKTTGPIEVRLAAEMVPQSDGGSPLEPAGGQADDQVLEAAGFEVLGAARQRGHIDFMVEGDWSTRWVEGSNVRRIDDLPEALRQQKVVARFEYYRQPCSLKVQVLAKESRVRVTPTYLLHVEAGLVRLDARFQYQVRGARAYGAKIDLGQWSVDRITPQELLQTELLDVEQTEPLELPFHPQTQPEMGEFELRIRAYREIAEGEQRLELQLPRPREAVLAPAVVVVSPADNVELTPRAEHIEGLVPESLPPQIELPPRQQTPLYFRTRATADQAVFVSDFQVRQQSVLASVASQVQLHDGQVQVEQRVAYRIAYEPLRQAVLDVPQMLAQSGDLKVSLDETAVPLTPLPESDEAGSDRPADSSGQRRVRMQVDLLEDRIGACELLLRYALPLPDLQADQSASLVVPLVLPADSNTMTRTTHTLNISYPDTLHVELDTGVWQPMAREGSQRGSARRHLELAADAGEDQVPLIVTLAQPQKHNSTIVHKAWIQTWLTAAGRRDRAAFRLVTHEPRVQIQLPGQARVETLEVALNGRNVADRSATEDGEVTVELHREGEAVQRGYVIELWYSFPLDRAAQGLHALDMPHVQGTGQIKRLYWQLVTPQNEHLCWGPGGLTPELQWRWQGLYWGRQASLSQQHLEQWIGASRQTPLPQATNQYLFTSFGAVQQVELVTASRRSILMVLSGVALLGGLLLLYNPSLRHPGVLFAGAVLLLAAGLWLPEPVLLAAQAASLGLFCVLVASLLDWTLVRRRYETGRRQNSSYMKSDSQVEIQFPRPEAGSQVTTATAPLLSSIPSGESKS